MPVLLDREAVGENIFELAFPSVAALVGGEAVEHRAICGLLQVQIEGGLDAQAVFMDLVGAEALFQFTADFFLKPRRDRRVGLRDVQAERSFAGFFGLLRE